jgi:hypothetical protein
MTQTHYELFVGRMLRDVDKAQKLIEVYLSKGRHAWHTVPFVMGVTDAFGISRDITKRFKRGDGWEAATQQYALIRHILDNQEDPYSYSQLLVDPEFLDHFSWLVRMGLPGGDVHVSMQLMHHMVCHERAGKRVYEVSQALGEKLLHTELRGIKGGDLRLPFEAVYIQIPPGVDVEIWNRDTGWHRAIGCYVCEERYMDPDDKYLLAADEREKFRGWRLMMVGESKDARGLPADDALSFFRVMLPDDVTLDEVVARCEADIQREMTNPRSTWTVQQTNRWKQQFFWVMNVILYATWEEPGEHWEANTELKRLWDRARKLPKGSPKRKRLNEQARQHKSQKRMRLGYKLVVDRSMRKSLDQSLERGEQPSRLCYVKTRVPGHWKAVAHGPKHSLRRQQWIAPYWRNKDGEEREEQPRHELKARGAESTSELTPSE